MSNTSSSIFRPNLPAPGIELSSPEGIALFQTALAAGTAGPFFRLIEQLSTQSEPAFCGLASLVTVLNAMGVDPLRNWKGPWRFYSEEFLDCCVPLEQIMRTGLDFAHFNCLARCNGLDVEAKRAADSSMDEFRHTLAETMRRNDVFVVACYSRQKLGQSGDGHYSPLGALAGDQVLILDVARFKYRPHWVPLDRLFGALNTLETGQTKSRGWFVLRLNKDAGGCFGPAPVRLQLSGGFVQAQAKLAQLRVVVAQAKSREDKLQSAATWVNGVLAHGMLPSAVVVELKGLDDVFGPVKDEWSRFLLLCLDKADGDWMGGLLSETRIAESGELQSLVARSAAALKQLLLSEQCERC